MKRDDLDRSDMILGGGLSGLIVAALNPHHRIVTKDLGGLINTPNIAPFMIHFSWAAKQFLEYINCHYHVARCKVGYYYGGRIYDDLPENLVIEYWEKSRGEKWPSKKKVAAIEYGHGDFVYLGVDLPELLQRLHDTISPRRKRISEYTVDSIDLENRILKIPGEYSFHYNTLISTVPAFVFSKLIGRQTQYRYAGKVFREKIEPDFNIGDYDYVYFPEKALDPDRLLRITRNTDGSFTHEYPYSPEFTLLKADGVVPYAYLLEPKKALRVKWVEFVGRYAEWDDDMLIHDVMDKFVWRSLK